MKQLMTGLQPGKLQLGNIVLLHRVFSHCKQENHIPRIMLADLHRLTSNKDVDSVAKLSKEAAETIHAVAKFVGLEEIVLYRQSKIRASTNAMWFICCLAKKSIADKVYSTCLDEHKPQTVGLFTYPVLVAADILLSGGVQIMVGKDQKFNMEFARETLRRYGAQFDFDPMYIDAQIYSLSANRKMSKTTGDKKSVLYFDDSAEEAEKKIMGAITDVDGVNNLLTILSILRGMMSKSNSLDDSYKLEFAKLKEDLSDEYNACMGKMHELVDPAKTQELLEQGEELMNKIAEERFADLQGSIPKEQIEA